jgi:hypothetical protein
LIYNKEQSRSALFLLKQRKNAIKHKASNAVSGVVQKSRSLKLSPQVKITPLLKKGKKKLKGIKTLKTGFKQGKINNKHAAVGLFDKPLVLEGKRERKPSKRLIHKWNEEYQKPTSPKQNEKQLQSLATKQRGKNILQKAKLCLNQAKLNKSKAALAASFRGRKTKADSKQSETGLYRFLYLFKIMFVL